MLAWFLVRFFQNCLLTSPDFRQRIYISRTPPAIVPGNGFFPIKKKGVCVYISRSVGFSFRREIHPKPKNTYIYVESRVYRKRERLFGKIKRGLEIYICFLVAGLLHLPYGPSLSSGHMRWMRKPGDRVEIITGKTGVLIDFPTPFVHLST